MRPEPAALVLDFLRLGLFLLVRSFSYMGFTVPLLGLSRSDFVFVLSIIDSTYLGFPLLVRSVTCLDLASSVLDFLHMGSSLPVRSAA